MTDKNKNLHFVSLGCARNQVDSEVMLGKLVKAGWQITDEPDEAEVIIINTCSFIEDAANESIDTILELSEFKKSGACENLIVVGCLPERYREKISEALPEVDIFLGTGAFDRIEEAAAGVQKLNFCTPANILLPDPDSITFPLNNEPRRLTIPHTAYLKIAEGCSRHCTYCIIPKLRGKQKSRPVESILSEAKELILSGVKELVLVAQDTTNYGKDLTPPVSLAFLLEKISNIAKDIWIRVFYGHPESIDENVIKVIASRENICSYYDIPVQHANSMILKKMGRNYTSEYLYELFDKIRFLDSKAVLRTTVIVGFPGETDKEFQELFKFIENIRFDNLGVFIYSDSDDLPSHKLPHHVTPRVAEKRYDRLMSRQMELSLQNNQKYIGSRLKVLTDINPEPNIFIGRTAFQGPEVDGVTIIRSENPLPLGAFTDVMITDVLEYDLIGERTV